MKNQSINQTRQFLTRRNTAKPLQGRKKDDDDRDGGGGDDDDGDFET